MFSVTPIRRLIFSCISFLVSSWQRKYLNKIPRKIEYFGHNNNLLQLLVASEDKFLLRQNNRQFTPIHPQTILNASFGTCKSILYMGGHFYILFTSTMLCSKITSTAQARSRTTAGFPDGLSFWSVSYRFASSLSQPSLNFTIYCEMDRA